MSVISSADIHILLSEHPMNKIHLSFPGVACAIGLDRKELWSSVTSGNQSGIKKIKCLNGNDFLAAKIDDDKLSPSSARFDMRIMQIEELALNQISSCIEKAKEKYGEKRIGVCVGSCDNGTEFSLKAHRTFFSTSSFPKNYSLEEQSADYVATFIAEKFDLQGPCLAFSTACSSSAGAIIKAAQLINSGIVDAIVAGGVDIASDTVLLGFDSLETISKSPANPFSKNRSGTTLGEGAAFFVMSCDPLDETGIALLGYGESSDAFHMTSPAKDGEGAEKAIKAALKSAGLKSSDIDYINLHGTGTRQNDSMEALATSRVFGEASVFASSTKPLTGHTLGAAAAIEAAVCFEAIIENRGKKDKRLPLHVWDKQRDEKLPKINLVESEKILSYNIKTCVSNSFAFGGANASLILGEL